MFYPKSAGVIDVLFQLKESLYQNKNIKRVLSYYLRASDSYTKNILSKLNPLQPRENFLANLQQLIKNVEAVPKRIALQIQSVLPYNSCLLLPNPSLLLVQTVEALEKRNIYIPVHTPHEMKERLDRRHTVIMIDDLKSISVDAALVFCNFSDHSILTDEKIYSEMKDHTILFVTTTNHYIPNARSFIMDGRIVTEQGVFSHKSLVEEIKHSVL